MPNRSRRVLSILLILLVSAVLFIPTQSTLAQEDDDQPVVRAVLFYSPTCGHCEKLIQTILPPLLAEYSDQLRIVAINVTLPEGQELYQAAVERYDISDDRRGVPTMIVDNIVMVGDAEVPGKLPGLVTDGIAKGGTDWPDIPGLAEVVAGVQFSSHPTGNAQTEDTQGEISPGETSPMVAKFRLDPVANTLAVIVLIGMVISIIAVVISFSRPVPEKDFWPKWVIPVLSLLGMGVAFYLAYVETSGSEAFCGPVGNCNDVQNSPYATLFGVLPVGLLGLIGYASIIVGWALYHFGPQSLRWVSAIAVWGMAFFGVLFSIYLTFLEPFVIGATCMWCISSAIIMTIIFLAATGPAKRAWQEDDLNEEDFEDEEELDEQTSEPKEEIGLPEGDAKPTEAQATDPEVEEATADELAEPPTEPAEIQAADIEEEQEPAEEETPTASETLEEEKDGEIAGVEPEEDAKNRI